MNDMFVLATICLIAMVSPGPDFLLITRNSLLYPRAQAFGTALGVIVGCIVHATYCTLGLALVITKSILLFSVIKYAGAAYLVYLGIKGLLSKKSTSSPTGSSSPSTISFRAAFTQGFLCNLLNPKLAVFLLSLFTQFISPDAAISEKVAVAGIFILESMMYWPLVVVAFQWKAIRSSFNRFQLYIDRAFGALLLSLGVKVALSRD